MSLKSFISLSTQKRKKSKVKMRQKLRKIQREGLLVESVLGLGWRGTREFPQRDT